MAARSAIASVESSPEKGKGGGKSISCAGGIDFVSLSWVRSGGTGWEDG